MEFGLGVWGLGFTFVRGLESQEFLRGLGAGKIDTVAAPGMRVGFRVSGFRFRVSDLGFRVPGFGFRAPGCEFLISGFGFRVSGLESRV